MEGEFAIPKGNEQKFVEIAERLGISKLTFLYGYGDLRSAAIREKLESIRTNVKLGHGFIVNAGNFRQASNEKCIIVAKSSADDRLLFEKSSIKIFYGFEQMERKDYIHQRASGLNHILCEIAQKNKIKIGFAYSALFDSKQKSATILGRMMQNLRLCRKYKVEILLASFADNPFHLRNGKDIESLFANL